MINKNKKLMMKKNKTIKIKKYYKNIKFNKRIKSLMKMKKKKNQKVIQILLIHQFNQMSNHNALMIKIKLKILYVKRKLENLHI
jgi:hypothetical protein